jgi:hypothetical protein
LHLLTSLTIPDEIKPNFDEPVDKKFVAKRPGEEDVKKLQA